MNISLNLNEQDSVLFQKYAEQKNMTVAELIRMIVLEKIEEDFDLKAYEKAMEEFRRNPVTYSLDEVKKELGIE